MATAEKASTNSVTPHQDQMEESVQSVYQVSADGDAKKERIQYPIAGCIAAVAQVKVQPSASVMRELDAKALSAKPFLMSSVEDVPVVCSAIAEILSLQPIFTGYSHAKCSKVLPIASSTLCRLCSIMSHESDQKLDANRIWPIRSFGDGYTVLDTRGKGMGYGLQLHIIQGIQPCLLATLQAAYRLVIQDVARGWKQADAHDYPGIYFKQDPQHWHLFVKNKKAFSEEDTLMACFVNLLGIAEYVKCNSIWRDSRLAWQHTATMYLWVRKKEYSQTAQALHPIAIPLQPPLQQVFLQNNIAFITN